MKILAIDGNSIINRAFYGIKLLSTKNGLYTNGIYGFMNILNKLMESENPDGVAVAFDLHAPTFRHKEYSEYKSGRKAMPEELAMQFPLLKNLLKAFGYKCLEFEGYEADDIIGTLARICENNGDECVIATGDRDSFQLVSDKTKVLLSATKMGRPEITEYTPEVIFEKYGVKPSGMIEIKALQGDVSDNIPGVSGIGEKTAGALIAKYGSIDYIYNNLENLDIKDSLKAKLINGKDSAYLSKHLGTIYRQVPLSEDVNDYKFSERNDAELAKQLVELEFFTLLNKLELNIDQCGVDLTDENKITEAVAVSESDILKLSDKCKKCYIIFNDSTMTVICEGHYSVIYLNEKTYIVKNILSGASEKCIYDSKPLFKWCIKNDVSVSNVTFDCVLAAYLINPSSSSYDMNRLSAEYKITVPETDDMNRYEATVLPLICEALEKENDKLGQIELLKNIEIPLAQVLAGMELSGFEVDTNGITQYGNELETRILKLKEEIYGFVGHEFNINSPKQLGVALFEEMGLPCKKKTKSGYSTNAEVLEGLRSVHPVIDLLLEYRTLTKLKSTYCDGLESAADGSGRIHSTFNQYETRTGRISSSEPNLQNIPVRRPEGKELRKYFKAKDGYVLCDADYSQIELRVLAHIADDTVMKNAFINGTDIHTLTASQVFNMPIDMVTPLMRSRAKAVNFGIVYGIGAFSLSKDIGVSRKEADEYIKGYLATYPQVDEYMHRVVDQAKKDGYVTTVFGRRRLLPELRGSNAGLRAFGERVARNMPIQGTAADIIKIAMIRVYDRLAKEMPEAKLIMQVHDELIVEAPESMAEKACEILKFEMENAVHLSVPMTVDAGYGKTWYAAKD